MKIPSLADPILGCNLKPIQSVVIVIVLFVLLAHTPEALASESFRSRFTSGRLDLGAVFTFFFLMLGPIKILGPFVTMTEGADSSFRTRLAIRATIFSCLALLVAALVGESSLESYGVSLNVLALTGGLVLSVVAFPTTLEQFQPPQKTETEILPLHAAVVRLAFPTIITPYGIAAVIIFTAVASGTSTKLVVIAMALGVLLLDFVAMLFARPLLKWLGAPLLIMGVVLAIIQLALGAQVVLSNLAALGVFTLRPS
jgi:multiple antibiotic resistance protein